MLPKYVKSVCYTDLATVYVQYMCVGMSCSLEKKKKKKKKQLTWCETRTVLKILYILHKSLNHY